jgi:arginase
MRVSSRLSVYQGPAGDHNDRAMRAVADLGVALSARLGVEASTVGEPVPADPTTWDVELERARPSLVAMAGRIEEVLAAGLVPVTAMTRCAVALATQPRVMEHHPDAVVVWLDAHGDINVPTDTATAFLGGMALSGPMGWWDSGLGAGLPSQQAVLVGSRDLDAAEAEHVRTGRVALVEPGPGLGDRLAAAIAGRPVYFHLDCDVLEPGIVATDYTVPDGLTLDDLHACTLAVSSSRVVGVEIAEYEGPGSAGPEQLLDALQPLL